MTRLVLICLAALSAGAVALGQSLDDSSLEGKFGFVQLAVATDPVGSLQIAASLGGAITFDGAGGYSFNGQSGSGANGLSAATGSGEYTVSSNGFVTMTNPVDDTLSVDGRIGGGSEILLGGSTDGVATYDIFIAVRSPSTPVDNTVINGRYTGVSLSFPNGSSEAVRTAFADLEADGLGGFQSINVSGHAASGSDLPLSDTISGATYSINGDGSGTMVMGNSSSLLEGHKVIFVSQTGDYIVGYSSDAGGRDVFVAIRNALEGASDQTFDGDFWVVDLFTNPWNNFYSTAVGAMHSTGSGVVTISQKQNLFGPLDFSGVNGYSLSDDATGYLGVNPEPDARNFAVGAVPSGSEGQGEAPHAFVGAQVCQSQCEVHGVTFGVRVPALEQPEGENGPFIAPLGVVNGASFAPATNPIAGGSLLSLYGAGLASELAQAEATPLPFSLIGVSVTVNGRAAPLLAVSPGQINFQAPFILEGATATIRVTNNGQMSNEVQVPVAATAPGVFSLQKNGFGPGIVTDTSFVLISEQSPAVPGQVLNVFLTGLGALNPPLAAGVEAPIDPLSWTTDPGLEVLFDGIPGNILFSGLAPDFIGLYQISVAVPNSAPLGPAVPLAIRTTNAYSDFVEIAINSPDGQQSLARSATAIQPSKGGAIPVRSRTAGP